MMSLFLILSLGALDLFLLKVIWDNLPNNY